ncbi:MAG: carbohydrate ABC transporter permease [Bacteroidia bacterium]|nr:carbohydrate ABC transporter permease [Bacteroidia bacterium]
MRRKSWIILIVYVALVVISGIIAFPFIWLIITAFKTYPDIYAYPILYLPKKITLEHFKYVFVNLEFSKYFFNSLFLGAGTAALTVLISILPAYATAKFDFFIKKPVLLSILVCQMFPQIVFVIPFFLFLKYTGLINSFLGTMIVYLPFTTPIAVWMARNFFADIPQSLEESALIDGCSRFQAFYKISLPLVIPGIASVGIYAFIFSWSELMFSLSYLTSTSKQTIPVFLSFFIGQYQTRWGPLFAGSVVAALPPMIVFGFLQKYFIKGLTSGSVKE